MKTKITFELKGKTICKIMRDGKQIGHMWSEDKEGGLPYPHEDKEYCHNSVQLCGFDKLDGDWSCGIYEGKRDIVAHFRNDAGEYMQQQIKAYAEYVQKFLEARVKEVKTGKETMHIAKLDIKGDLGKMMNFDDWFRTGGAFD